MIALVVYACLATQPETCGQTIVTWSDSAAELSCTAAEPATLTLWKEAHPEMVVSRHWCMPDRSQLAAASATSNDPRILPLDPCQVTSRAQGIVWQARNPGLPAVRACAEARLSN